MQSTNMALLRVSVPSWWVCLLPRSRAIPAMTANPTILCLPKSHAPSHSCPFLIYIHPMALLSIRDLVKVYQTDEGIFGKTKLEVRAVNGVSLDITQGETLGMVGESGCGKTTLGRMILRLIEPTSGSITFNGDDVLGANGGEVRRLPRGKHIIFQDPLASLNPRMRVEEILTQPLVIHPGMTASES